MTPTKPASYVTPAERIRHWSGRGCALARDERGWRLAAPPDWPWPWGPAPTPIPEAAAREAIRAGVPVERGVDLFAADDARRAA